MALNDYEKEDILDASDTDLARNIDLGLGATKAGISQQPQPQAQPQVQQPTTGSGLPDDIAKQKQDYLDNYRGVQQEVGMPKNEEFTPRKSEWDLFSDSLLGFVGGLIVSGGNPLAGAFMATAAYIRGSDYNYRYDQLGNIEGVSHFGKQQWLMDGNAGHLAAEKKKEVGTIERFNNTTNSFDTYTLFDDGTHSTKSVEKETKWGNINLADGRKVAVKLKANGEFDVSGIDFNKKDANGKAVNEWSDDDGAIKARVIDEDTYNAAKERELELHRAKSGIDLAKSKSLADYNASINTKSAKVINTTVYDENGKKRAIRSDDGGKTWKDALTNDPINDISKWTIEKVEEPLVISDTDGTNSDAFWKAQPSMKLSEAQGKSKSFAEQGSRALGEMGEMLNKGHNPASLVQGMYNLLPGMLKSGEAQVFNNAAGRLVNALNRKDSGAAITPSELKEAFELYIPLPTDKPETVRRKLAASGDKLNGYVGESGAAGPFLRNQVRMNTQPLTNYFGKTKDVDKNSLKDQLKEKRKESMATPNPSLATGKGGMSEDAYNILKDYNVLK